MAAYEDRFHEPHATTVQPSCNRCRHYHRATSGPATCDAFPDGIPREILTARHDHKSPFPGDRGIRFEPLPEK